MNGFHRRFFNKEKQQWVEEDGEDIPCPTPIRSIPPPELWEEYNQRWQVFANQPPRTGLSKEELDLNLPYGSPERCSQDLVKNGDEQDHGGASGPSTTRVFEDNRKSYGSNSGPMPTNPKQPFQLFPEQGKPLAGGAANFGDRINGFQPYIGQHHPTMDAANAGGGFGGFPVYVDQNRPAIGATNTGGGIAGGFQPFPEQYWERGKATVGCGVGGFPTYPGQNRPPMGATYVGGGGVGGTQMCPNRNPPATANSGDVGSFPVPPAQNQPAMGTANEGGGVGCGLQLCPEHDQPAMGASNAESEDSEFPGIPDLNLPANGATNEDSENDRSFQAGARKK